MPIETALLQWRRMSDLHGCDVIGEVFSRGLTLLFPNLIPGRASLSEHLGLHFVVCIGV